MVDELDVAALGVRLVKAWPLIDQYPERWAQVGLLSTPALRNSGLVIEAVLETD